jgi:hypothetical protein
MFGMRALPSVIMPVELRSRSRLLNRPAFLDMQEETLEDGIVEATSQPRCQSRECRLAYLCSNPPQSGGHPLRRTYQPSC